MLLFLITYFVTANTDVEMDKLSHGNTHKLAKKKPNTRLIRMSVLKGSVVTIFSYL